MYRGDNGKYFKVYMHEDAKSGSLTIMRELLQKWAPSEFDVVYLDARHQAAWSAEERAFCTSGALRTSPTVIFYHLLMGDKHLYYSLQDNIKDIALSMGLGRIDIAANGQDVLGDTNAAFVAYDPENTSTVTFMQPYVDHTALGTQDAISPFVTK